MAVTTDIMVRFLADAKGVKDATNEVEGTGSKLKGWASSTAGAIGGAFAGLAIADFAKDAIGAASDLGESISKVGVVFGTSAGDIEAWASTAATSMGMSEQAALQAAGTYGNLAVSLGLPQDKAAEMSTSLVSLASDMASFNNVPVGDALAALQSGLTGETEPLKKFGVNMNDAALQAQALAMGLSDGKAPLTAAAKAQASYALILEQTSTAQGDFARTSDGMANQQKIATAQFDDMKATLGTAVLPILTELVGILNQYLIPALQMLSTFIQQNSSWLIPLVAVIATLVAGIKLWTIAQAALNVVMSANPIGLIVIAIAALVAGIILAYQNCETFRDIVDAAFKAVAIAFSWIIDAAEAVFNWVRDNWPLLLGILTGPFGLAVVLIQRNWQSITDAGKAVWDWLNTTWGQIQDFITAPFKAAWDIIAGIWGDIKSGATGVYDWVKDKFTALVDAVKGIINGVRDAVGDVVDAIKGPINAVIRGWNGLSLKVPTITLPKVDLGPLGTIGGQSFGGWTFDFPNIPTLARGGIVTGPTLAMLGEAGRPEAVVPLPRAGAFGGTRNYSLSVNVEPGTDPAAVGRRVVRAIQAFERRDGTSWRERRPA